MIEWKCCWRDIEFPEPNSHLIIDNNDDLI